MRIALRVVLVFAAVGCRGEGGRPLSPSEPQAPTAGPGAEPTASAAEPPAPDLLGGVRAIPAVPGVARTEASWYPLEVGARWAYRVRPNHPGLSAPNHAIAKTTVVEAVEPGGGPGTTTFRVRTTRGQRIELSWDERRGDRIVRLKEERRPAHGPVITATSTPGRLRFDAARMQVGATWTESYEIAVGGVGAVIKRIERWTVESLDDPVLVPAGRFRCARLRLAWTRVENGRAVDNGVKVFFYARGVGKVAEAAEDSTEELVSFSIPGQPAPLPVQPVPPAPESAPGACNDRVATARAPALVEPSLVLNRVDARGALRGSARGHVGVTVVQQPPPPPLSGGTLLVLRDGKIAVASDPDRDRVWVVDLAAERPVAEVRLRTGDEPGRLAEDAAGRVHVVLRGGGDLVTLDPGCWAITARRPVCSAPRGVASAGGLVHVACAGGELVSLAAAGGAPVRTRQLERDLRDVLVDDDGRLLVTTFRQAQVLRVDDDGAVDARLTPPSIGSRNRPRPPGVAPNDDPFVPAVAWRAVRAPRGDRLYVLHQRMFSGVMGTEPGRYYGTQDPCTSVAETVVTAFDAAGAARPGSWIARATLPLDLAVSGDGARVALVAAGNAHVGDIGAEVFVARAEVFAEPGAPDCAVPEVPPELTIASGGRAPEDPALEFPPGLRRIKAYPVRGEPTAVAFDRRGHVVVQTREPATLQLPRLGKTIWLSHVSRYDTGHAIFHGNAGRYIACASCHPEGADDGRVWRFAFSGPRRTQSLRGGVLEAPPFHWDGDLRDLAHLMDDVFVRRMTGPRLGPEQTIALRQWMNGLPHLRAPPARDPAAAERGRALYFRLACASCHGGDQPAMRANVDVGTGKPFQVPSLRGLVFRAPYMHDGCAPSLAARFLPGRCGGDERHGNTGALGEGEIADLVAYLETL